MIFSWSPNETKLIWMDRKLFMTLCKNCPKDIAQLVSENDLIFVPYDFENQARRKKKKQIEKSCTKSQQSCTIWTKCQAKRDKIHRVTFTMYFVPNIYLIILGVWTEWIWIIKVSIINWKSRDDDVSFEKMQIFWSIFSKSVGII